MDRIPIGKQQRPHRPIALGRALRLTWHSRVAMKSCYPHAGVPIGRHTVLDGLREKFKVVLLTDSVRGVNLKPGDSERAIAEMLHAGAEIVADQQQFTE